MQEGGTLIPDHFSRGTPTSRRSPGTGILFVEQDARMVLAICHRAYIFEIGRIAFEGPRSYLTECPLS